jgi:hypothetical protein
MGRVCVFLSLFALLVRNSADIVRDFSNQVVQEEWTKFRASVLNRQNDRARELSRLEQQRRAEAEMAREQQHQRLRALDDTLDELNAAFADAAIALEHDARALDRQLETVGGPRKNPAAAGGKDVPAPKASVPCLGPRAHWMDCVTKYRIDTRPCDAYLATLERCVQETVVKLATNGGGGGSSTVEGGDSSLPASE